MFLYIWFCSGLIGVALERLSWIHPLWGHYRKNSFLCMSPFSYICLISLGLTAGLIVFLHGLLMYLAICVPWERSSNLWFFRPICKK